MLNELLEDYITTYMTTAGVTLDDNDAGNMALIMEELNAIRGGPFEEAKQSQDQINSRVTPLIAPSAEGSSYLYSMTMITIMGMMLYYVFKKFYARTQRRKNGGDDAYSYFKDP